MAGESKFFIKSCMAIQKDDFTTATNLGQTKIRTEREFGTCRMCQKVSFNCLC